MDDKIFKACLKEKTKSKNGDSFWAELAQRFGYQNKNSIRKAFNREVVLRGGFSALVELPSIKIASMDLENLPPRGYTGWGMREQYISQDMIVDDKTLLAWAAMDAQTGEIVSDVLTPKEAKSYNSKRLTHTLREYIDNVDVVIGFNWRDFDAKLLTTELTLHSLWPVAYRTIDVYQLLRQKYGLTSYSLKFFAHKFGIREKTPNEGFGLWRKCAEGNPDALQEMLTYNEGDVISTFEAYKTIAPYVGNSLVNFGVYSDSSQMTCSCGSTKFHSDGQRYWATNSALYDRYRCSKCGAIYRGKKNMLSKKELAELKIRL